MNGSTATTDGAFEGAFESSYKGTMKTRFNPPMQGMSESNMTQEAHAGSALQSGSEAGRRNHARDGRRQHPNDMMKDPKMQEMMRKQQR